MFSISQFWFGFFCFFTPGMFYDTFILQFFDVLFTLLPIFFFGVFDKSYSKSKQLFSPNLYFPGLINNNFNFKLYIKVSIESFCYSVFITMAAINLFDWGHYKDGNTFGYWTFTNMCFFGTLFFLNTKVLFFSNSYTLVGILINFCSTGAYLILWIW